MKKNLFVAIGICSFLFTAGWTNQALAQAKVTAQKSIKKQKTIAQMTEKELDNADFNPFAEDTGKKLEQMDAEYLKDTGANATEWSPSAINSMFESFTEVVQKPACKGIDCHVYVDVQKSLQTFNLYVDGQVILTGKTSTGRAGFGTPNFDKNPDGRIYKVYSSSKYPGYNNMPFAVFIKGGFAIHGAPGGEERQLGHVASHGCVRVKTSNAKIINETISQAIREQGIKSVWISVRP